jgi:alkylhydroperoxidase family enzyme
VTSPLQNLEERVMQTATAALRPQMKNPAAVIPGAWQAVQALHLAGQQGGVLAPALAQVHLRANQINRCSAYPGSGPMSAKQAGETGERIFAVSAWREPPPFSEADRAALALTEAATRLSDRPGPVPDEIWDQAATTTRRDSRPWVLMIATANAFTRLNVTIRQPAGAGG